MHKTTSVRGPCSNWERGKHNVQPTNHLRPCTDILRSHRVLCQLDTMEGRGQPPDAVLGLVRDPAASPVGVLLGAVVGLLAVLGGDAQSTVQG